MSEFPVPHRMALSGPKSFPRIVVSGARCGSLDLELLSDTSTAPGTDRIRVSRAAAYNRPLGSSCGFAALDSPQVEAPGGPVSDVSDSCFQLRS